MCGFLVKALGDSGRPESRQYLKRTDIKISVVKKGKTGADEIKRIMSELRSTPPKSIAGSNVTLIKDYDTLRAIDVSAGATTEMDMPESSNVLQFFTADGTKISVRPSGTEPKIKFYVGTIGTSEADVATKLDAFENALNEFAAE